MYLDLTVQATLCRPFGTDMSKMLYCWRRWIIFFLLVAATWGMGWITEPRPKFSWVYEKSLLVNTILEPLKLESASADGRWLFIRRTDAQNFLHSDLIDLSTGQIKAVLRRLGGSPWPGEEWLDPVHATKIDVKMPKSRGLVTIDRRSS